MKKQVYLSLPLHEGPGHDLGVGLGHHGDQHVEQEDGHEYGEEDHQDARHHRLLGLLDRTHHLFDRNEVVLNYLSIHYDHRCF